MARRKYSDREKAEALAALKANGGNIFRTSHELKIPWATLADWAKGSRGINHGVTELREEKEDQLAAICERVARKYLAQAENPWAIASTPGNQAMMTAAVAIDKNRLLLGKATDITGSEDSGVLIGKIIAAVSKRDSANARDIAYQLQQRFADRNAEDYDASLDPTVHPEVWPDGNLLGEQPPQVVEGEQ